MDATQPEATASRLDRLLALRASIESMLNDGIPARELSALSREYRATLAEIEELAPKIPEGDVVDQIAERRAARRSVPPKPAGRAKRSG